MSDPLKRALTNSASNIASTSLLGTSPAAEGANSVPADLINNTLASIPRSTETQNAIDLALLEARIANGSATQEEIDAVARNQNEAGTTPFENNLDNPNTTIVEVAPEITGPPDSRIAEKSVVTTSVNHGLRFIPIMIETEFAFTTSASGSKKRLFMLFDSTPESISFSRSAAFNQQVFPGRSEPIWTYSNTSAPTFSLTGKFFANSWEEHQQKLALSEKLMSLVLPSKTNFMPSPVIVSIGEWKKLRCIVNSVNMKFTGPWALSGDAPIALHSPRYFEADMSFTVVSDGNKVSYAEDVLGVKQNNKYNSDDEIKEINSYKSAMDIQFLQGVAFGPNRGMTAQFISTLAGFVSSVLGPR